MTTKSLKQGGRSRPKKVRLPLNTEFGDLMSLLPRRGTESMEAGCITATVDYPMFVILMLHALPLKVPRSRIALELY